MKTKNLRKFCKHLQMQQWGSGWYGKTGCLHAQATHLTWTWWHSRSPLGSKKTSFCGRAKFTINYLALRRWTASLPSLVQMTPPALKWHEAECVLLPTGCSELQKEIFCFFTKKAFGKQMEKKWYSHFVFILDSSLNRLEGMCFAKMVY